MLREILECSGNSGNFETVFCTNLLCVSMTLIMETKQYPAVAPKYQILQAMHARKYILWAKILIGIQG